MISNELTVVRFNHLGAIEILRENEHGIIVNMGDTEQFYKELAGLMNSYEQRKLWSGKGLKRSQDFKIDAIREEWSAIIK